jgi:hypothetical protein
MEAESNSECARRVRPAMIRVHPSLLQPWRQGPRLVFRRLSFGACANHLLCEINVQKGNPLTMPECWAIDPPVLRTIFFAIILCDTL